LAFDLLSVYNIKSLATSANPVLILTLKYLFFCSPLPLLSRKGLFLKNKEKAKELRKGIDLARFPAWKYHYIFLNAITFGGNLKFREWANNVHFKGCS
jgi:hypothetical protein